MTPLEFVTRCEGCEVVRTFEASGIVIMWNKSLTLSMFVFSAMSIEEIEVRTLSEVPKTQQAAQDAARSFYNYFFNVQEEP